MKPRFFYLVPNIGWWRFDGESRTKHLKRLITGNCQPSGGVQVIYQHCDILNRNGFDAYPVNLSYPWNSFRADWFEHKTQPISSGEARRMMKETDVIICPEVIPMAVLDFPAENKVLFVQNWALVRELKSVLLSTEILTVSPFCAEFMLEMASLPVSVVTNGIDLDLFKPAPEKRVSNKVLFWGRKNRNDGLEAIELLPPNIRQSAKFVEASNGLTQTEVARLYRESSIFMALGYPEGFGLPPLEAMACGCAVIGFTGGAGRVHMIEEETALIAEDGNLSQLSKVLERVLTDSGLREKIRAGGLKKAQEFTPQRMEKELLVFARKFQHS